MKTLFSRGNSTWSSWVNLGTGTRLDGGWMWRFKVGGYYEFYSIATDGAGNRELVGSD